TFTFCGITSYLPLYAAEKDIAGIVFYFISYAAFLMLSRLFAGKIYDKKGDLMVIPPGIILIFIAMLLLPWLPNLPTLLFAGALYGDRKSTRLNSSHVSISYAVFCLKKKT